MSDTDDRKPRLVVPRRSVLAGSAAVLGTLAAAPAWAQTASAGGEGGEGGEGAATANLDGPVEMLVELGLFEATHRIVAALYAEGLTDDALSHLEQSHHASFEDIEHALEEYAMDEAGAHAFEDLAEAFADAVKGGADAAVVADAAAAVLATAAEARSQMTAKDEFEAIEALLNIAHDDYEAGVAEGVVDAPQEYRDAWGFTEVARARLTALAASSDATVAGAGAAGLKALEPAAALFPGIGATEVPGADPSVLAGAAARIEIAGLRLK